MKRTRKLIFMLLALLAVSCEEIDCPLENTVELQIGFYDSDGTAYELDDTLSVLAAGTDSILYNSGYGITSVEVPVSYSQEADTLLLQLTDASGRTATDSIIYGHTNMVHFENIDCPAAVFHVITSVRWTSHDPTSLPLTIDSVAIVAPNINYNAQENLRVYVRTR